MKIMVTLIWVSSGYLFGQAILPPGNPKPNPPKAKSDMDADVERMKRRRALREAVGQSPESKLHKKKMEMILEQTLNPGPTNLHMSLTFVYPYVKTSGSERENYQTEPGVFYHLYLRPSNSEITADTHIWTGFRLAPISGSGTYKKVGGRFSFLYFGPMIGIGSISLPVKNLGRDDYQLAEATGESEAFHRSGYFIVGGIAAQSRLAGLDQGVQPPDDDLDRTDVELDSPGLWMEATYVSIYYNAIGIDYTLGVQLGKRKTFVYLGIGSGYWY